VRERVEAAIREYIEPLVHADGGRIELIEATEGSVVLRLSGACAGCPGKPYTLEGVITPVLRRVLGVEIKVVAVP
jgi:Fe-S cluster biogenesis protein NfuA